MTPAVDIVIVNFNTGPLLRECVESIPGISSGGLRLSRVVVVDNASSDGSASGLDPLEGRLELIENDSNRGFAAACNQGAASSSADYLLFLNPDTRLSVSSLSAPVGFMQSEEASSIAICGVRNVSPDGKGIKSTLRFPSFVSVAAGMIGLPHLVPEVRFEESGTVDQVIGAFLLIRRAVFERLAGFDERFFLYFEDVDLCLRARKEGLACYYLASAEVCHAGRSSSRAAPEESLSRFLGSRIRYCFKHLPAVQAWVLLVLTFTIEPVTRLVWSLTARSTFSPAEVIRAYGRLLYRLGREGLV